MAFQKIRNVAIKGIAACVPKNAVNISDLPLFKADEAQRFSESTGVYSIRISEPEITSSDLVFHAAE